MHLLPATFSKHLKHQQQSRTSNPRCWTFWWRNAIQISQQTHVYFNASLPPKTNILCPKLVLSIHLPKKQLRHFPSAPQLPFRSAPWYEDLQNTSASSPSLDVRGYGKQWYGMVMFGEKFFDALGTFWNTNEKSEKTPVTVFCAFFFLRLFPILNPQKKQNTVVSNISMEGGYDGFARSGGSIRSFLPIQRWLRNSTSGKICGHVT